MFAVSTKNSGHFFIVLPCTKIHRYGIIQSKYVYRAAVPVYPEKQEVWKGASLHV